jgi:sporulation protein YlmC with PRC-barrel domain
MTEEFRGKSVTRDNLIKMRVIDANGYLIGTVKDVSFIVGKSGISLTIEDKEGETKIIPWEDIQAIGDFVLLKPRGETQPTGQQPTTAAICPTCKGPLTYIPQYKRWYCYKCQKYA